MTDERLVNKLIAEIILPPGWKYRKCGYYEFCRICHEPCSISEPVIIRGRMYYHVSCVKKSPAYKKAIKNLIEMWKKKLNGWCG